MSRRSRPRAAAAALVLGLVAGAAPGAGAREPTPPAPTVLPHPAFARPAAAGSASIADIAERSLPSVVNISSLRVLRTRAGPFSADPFFRFFFGPGFGIPRERRQRSLGSGVIVDKAGVILTNNHVVANATQIKVTLADKREFLAKLVGADPKSDLAVLRLQGDVKSVTPIALGDSSRLRLGDVVLAIGNPFGVGQTVTMGIVSAKGRANVGIVDYEDFIQTDAAINPGNSGGALINMKGELVGINTAILSRSGGYQGIGFAIPANMAKPIMESLLRLGRVVRGWLGVSIQKLTPALAKAFGVDVSSGALISHVSPGSPAEKGGLRSGDVVVAFNGEAIDSAGRLRNLVAVTGAHGKARLEVLRRGKRLALAVELTATPAGAAGILALDPRDGALGGLTVGGLGEPAREKYRIPREIRYGVAVERIAPGSPAADVGLAVGDVLLELSRQPIRSIADFAQLYRAARGRTLLLVYRQGSTIYLVVQR